MSSKITDWTLEGIKNPLRLQGTILDLFEKSTDGEYAIVDGNNVTSFLIEAFASMASGALQKIDDSVLPAIYPSRAVSASDLYKHLSDYDYLGLFSSPASCSIILIVDKDYLMRRAVEVKNDDGTVTYSKVIIPQTTRFKVGAYTFGLYYPIEIRVSNQTGMFTVMYDTSKRNPLSVLSQNILEYNYYRRQGMNLAYIKIPVFQFDTTTVEEPLINGSGYRRIITYSDQFYALKCTAEVRNTSTNTWESKELALALSGRSYNPEDPTVIFTVDPDNKEVTLEIPYVYFTQDRIRGNLRVDIYTSAGYLNYQIPTNTSELVGIDMFTVPLDDETAKYAEPFRTMPALGAIPTTMKVVGGTDGYSYEDLRRKIVTDAFGIDTLQTPADVDAYFANEGYVTSLFKDGITDRIFNAHATLRDNSDAIISAGCVGTQITLSNLTLSNTSTIIDATGEGNVFTILPSTRYRFDTDKGICIPLTDVEMMTLNQLGPSDKVLAFNNNIYTLSPFHIQISIKDKYPSTATYDLKDAEIESREFLVAREETSQHMSLNTATMEVVPVDSSIQKNTVTDKYKLTFKVIRSGLDDVSVWTTEGVIVRQMRAVVALKKADGGYMFADADWKYRQNDIDVYELEISATAAFRELDGQHAIRIKNPFSEYGSDVYLTAEMRVILCARQGLGDLKRKYKGAKWFEDEGIDFTNSGLDRIGEFVALSEHRLTVRFGKLVNELDQRISLTYSGDSYKTYNTTEMDVLETDQYETDENGVPIFDSDVFERTGEVKLVVKYPSGTLTSTTVIKEEEAVLSKYFKENFAGCEWMAPTEKVSSGVWKGDGTWLTGEQALPSATAAFWTDGKGCGGYEGRTTSIKMPVIPKLFIKTAKMSLAGDNPMIGSYELANAAKAGRFSSPNHEWYRVYLSKDGKETVNAYKIEVKSALQFVLEHVLATKVLAGGYTKKDVAHGSCHVLDGAIYGINDESESYIKGYMEDPLKTNFATLGIAPTEGMFVLMENDKSSNICSASTNLVSDQNTVVAPAKLYYYTNGEWKCLLMCDNFNALCDFIDHDLIGYRAVGPDAVDVTHNKYQEGIDYYYIDPVNSRYIKMTAVPDSTTIGAGVKNQYHIGGTIGNGVYCLDQIVRGYVYVISRVEPTTWAANETEVEYVSFLTVDDSGCPDFTPFKLTTNVEGVAKSPDSEWQSRVDKWPWEVTNWKRMRLGAIIDDNGDDAGARVYETDELFSMTFDTARMSKYCVHLNNQIILNEGRPVVDTDKKREVQYLINMIQVDAKIAETSTNKATLAYPNDIITTMRTHFNNLGAIKNRLYTNTKLYFEPMKSLGFGMFYTDGETTKEYPLDVRMGFRLHVSSDIADDEEMKETMRDSIIKLIDDHMEAGSTNMAEIAKLIKDNYSDSVRYVDVLGIDGDKDLQTMRCVDSEVRPHLKHELKLLDDGVTIDITRGLDLEFVVADV